MQRNAEKRRRLEEQTGGTSTQKVQDVVSVAPGPMDVATEGGANGDSAFSAGAGARKMAPTLGIVYPLEDSDQGEDEAENGNAAPTKGQGAFKLLEPPVEIYYQMRLPQIEDKLWEFYPVDEDEGGTKERIVALIDKFDLPEETKCHICLKTTSSTGQKYTMQCIGVMDGNIRCRRRSHRRCAALRRNCSGQLYACKDEGCCSNVLEDTSDRMTDIIHVWFYMLTKQLDAKKDFVAQNAVYKDAVKLLEYYDPSS